MYIIIRNKNSWKGKTVSEMQRNLVSEGWPQEVSDEQLDKMAHWERKAGRALRPEDVGRRKKGKK